MIRESKSIMSRPLKTPVTRGQGWQVLHGSEFSNPHPYLWTPIPVTHTGYPDLCYSLRSGAVGSSGLQNVQVSKGIWSLLRKVVRGDVHSGKDWRIGAPQDIGTCLLNVVIQK